MVQREIKQEQEMGHAGDLNRQGRDSLTKQVTSEQQSVGDEGGSHQRKRLPGSGNSQCKGPEVGGSEKVWLEQSERGREWQEGKAGRRWRQNM